MDGQNLSVLFEGGEPEPRDHFTLCYSTFVCTRNERYVMFSRNDGSGAKLYDIKADPLQQRDLADDTPETVDKMYEEYALKDAGGSLSPY